MALEPFLGDTRDVHGRIVRLKSAHVGVVGAMNGSRQCCSDSTYFALYFFAAENGKICLPFAREAGPDRPTASVPPREVLLLSPELMPIVLKPIRSIKIVFFLIAEDHVIPFERPASALKRPYYASFLMAREELRSAAVFLVLERWVGVQQLAHSPAADSQLQ